MDRHFQPYIDPDYRTVERVLKSEVPYRTKSVKQFDVPSYYRANVKNKTAPIYVQHGLQNFAQVQLGDNRLRYERSFSHEVFRPYISRANPDKGMSEEHIMSNRKRDYQYCRQVLQGRVAETCDEVLAAIKLKLKIRTKIGLYELIETFKHFAEDGKEGITYPQMRMVFEMMGFTFSDNQVLALFAQFDTELRGEISYKDFIRRLLDGDYVEARKKWLRLTRLDDLPPRYRAEREARANAGQHQRLEERRHELSQLFAFVDASSLGSLRERRQVELLLITMGADLLGEGLGAHVDALVKLGGEGGVTFEAFWEYACSLKR